MGQEGADIPTFFTLHSETNEIPPRRTDVQNLLSPPPPPAENLFSYVKYISSAYIPSYVSPLLSFHPHMAGLDLSPSSPVSIFLTLYYSCPAHLYFSISVCFPSHPMLASHMFEPFAQSLPLKIQTWKKKKTVLASNSPVSRQFLFLPFYQPRLSHPQHHCWSWIFRSFQANVFNLPLLLPSLSLLTLFHLTWLFTHWCSDAKVMNSQQNAVCFNWRTMEILQEETFFMVCVQHVFISVWLNVVHQSRKT